LVPETLEARPRSRPTHPQSHLYSYSEAGTATTEAHSADRNVRRVQRTKS
jgi:hypothetical protein